MGFVINGSCNDVVIGRSFTSGAILNNASVLREYNCGFDSGLSLHSHKLPFTFTFSFTSETALAEALESNTPSTVSPKLN